VTTTAASTRPRTAGRAHPALGRSVVGGFFLVMGGVHLGLVSADPQVYRHFADHGLFGFVRTGWSEIVMADPSVYGLLLMVVGWWVWAWSLPVLALLVWLASRDFLAAQEPS